MTRVALPSRDRAPRVGLASLWQSDASPIESTAVRLASMLSVLVTRLRASPLAALAAVMSLCAVISLAFLLIVIAASARQTVTQGAAAITIRVVPLRADAVDELEQRLAKLPSVRATRVISKAEALEEFSQALGASKGLLAGIENDNPLPVTIELSLRDLGSDPRQTVNNLVEQLQREAGVEEVVYNASLLSSLGSLLAGIRWFGVVTIVVVLLIGSLLVGMTIRLGVYAHRHEIEVMQLVGADRRHIQMPFLIEAVSVGILASLLSSIIVFFSVKWLGAALSTSSVRWLVAEGLPGIPLWVWCGMLVTGPLLAFSGALAALRLQGHR